MLQSDGTGNHEVLHVGFSLLQMLKRLISICFALIGVNPLVCLQVDMHALDTLPMETEAATEVSSPHVAMVPQHGPQPVKIAQMGVPQQMAQPVPYQPAVSPSTQASLVHMPAHSVEPLAVPPAPVAPEVAPANPAVDPLPTAAPLQPVQAPVTVSEPTQPLTLAPAVLNESAQPAAPAVVMQPLTLAPQLAAAPEVKPAQPLTLAPPVPNQMVAPQPAQQPAAPVVKPAQPMNLATGGVPNEIAQPEAPVAMPVQPLTSALAAVPMQAAAPVTQPVQPLPAMVSKQNVEMQPVHPAAPVVQPMQPLTIAPGVQPVAAQPAQPDLKPVLPPAVAPQPGAPATPPMVAPAVVQQSQQQKPDVSAAEGKKKEEEADKELEAMGWLTRSCRPQASPQGTSAPAGNVDGSAEKADALRRQKSQVFTPPPQPSQTQPVAAPPQAAAAVKLQQFGTPQLVAPQSAKPQPMDAEYSRRAAANLLARLKKNPQRLEGLPSLRSMVFDAEKKNDLISMLCENGGNLEQVQMHLQQQEERGRVFSAKKKALRFTKKQMRDAYGEDADKVMKYKESIGMTEDDENCPDGVVYLVAQREDEEDDYTSTLMTTGRVQVTQANAADVADVMTLSGIIFGI
eukprot:s3947_g2.t1